MATKQPALPSVHLCSSRRTRRNILSSMSLMFTSFISHKVKMDVEHLLILKSHFWSFRCFISHVTLSIWFHLSDWVDSALSLYSDTISNHLGFISRWSLCGLTLSITRSFSFRRHIHRDPSCSVNVHEIVDMQQMSELTVTSNVFFTVFRLFSLAFHSACCHFNEGF